MLAQYDQAARDHIVKRRTMQQRFETIFKADAEPDDDAIDDSDEDSDDETGNGEPRHLVEELADLLVEGGTPDGEVTREQALQWLLHSARGQTLVERMARRNSNRKDSSMTRSEHLKADGVRALCKRIVRNGNSGDISEAELVGLITGLAKQEYATDDDATAFTKLFSALTPQGEMLRRAVQVAKFTQLYGAK
jgi:hypothetical protein